MGALVEGARRRGHAFGSHTYDHVYWQGDLPDGKFRVKPSAGPQTGKVQTWTAQQYCEEIKRSSARFTQMTGHAMLPVPRAGRQDLAGAAQGGARMRLRARGLGAGRFPGRRAAQRQIPNARLLEQALRNIKPGDILLAHLGIWSRQDPGPRRAGAAG